MMLCLFPVVVNIECDCATLFFEGLFLGEAWDCVEDGCPTADSSCLIISEVVDGHIGDGYPKWMEIMLDGREQPIRPC